MPRHPPLNVFWGIFTGCFPITLLNAAYQLSSCFSWPWKMNFISLYVDSALVLNVPCLRSLMFAMVLRRQASSSGVTRLVRESRVHVIFSYFLTSFKKSW